jgi:hypothetical protein
VSDAGQNDAAADGTSTGARECSTARDCPRPAGPGECATRVCVAGRCAVEHAEQGTVLAAQTAEDCRKAVCDGEGHAVEIDDDDDVADDGLSCTRDRCSDGSVLHEPEPAGTACAQDGGKVCSGIGACVECARPSDCTSDVCQDGACRAPPCGNGAMDPDESDIDCGGSCGRCGPGRACIEHQDCTGQECSANECVANCQDAVRNRGESDVDCGASCPSACANGQRCGDDDDCSSGFCHPADERCAEPSCSDGFMNRDELAVDCGGSCPSCPIACQWNEHCGTVDVCYQNVCVHSVNGCSIDTATDLRGMANVAVEFDGAGYVPSCLLVTMYTQITFNGAFADHPLVGGHVEAGEKFPAGEGPFVPATSAGSSQTFPMDSCATFPFYCDEHALSGMMGAVFVVPP